MQQRYSNKNTETSERSRKPRHTWDVEENKRKMIFKTWGQGGQVGGHQTRTSKAELRADTATP
jgi:hypothetical protein